MRNVTKILKCVMRPFTILLSVRILGAWSIIFSVALAFSVQSSVAQQIVLPAGNPPVQDPHAKYHTGPLGKPCLTLQGYAKPETVNKNIYQHWISAANSCGQIIRVHVCYFETEECILMTVPPWDRKDSVLGIFPALKRFQYQAKEQF
jgi:hypothetical protein